MGFEEHADAQQDRHVNDLLEFVRIPSISALPAHAADVRRAAEWVAARLQRAGIEHTRVMETGGHPVVYGDWLHAGAESPVILIYGHLDVQPVDPLDLWTRPPFEPYVADDRVHGRGASDSKGNMLAPIAAVESMLAAEGGLPVNLKFCFEGQEEIGSPQINEFLAREKEVFASDLAVSSDGGQWSETEPSLSLALRGVCGVQITLRGPSRDLHSGSFGGAVHNPIHALTDLVAGMHRADGSVNVECFYDDVEPLTPEERQDTARVPFDEADYMDDLGIGTVYGEAGYSTRERTWHRPTLEVNGIWGGFQGEGIKTVLPSEAHAKITCRLVANQDPRRIRQLLDRHVQAHVPPGIEATVEYLTMNGKPYVMPADHWGNRAAVRVLTELYGQEPYYVRSGGSIPICGDFLERLGVYTVNMGFGLPDEKAHSPDEFFRLSSFRRSQTAYRLLLHELARSAG